MTNRSETTHPPTGAGSARLFVALAVPEEVRPAIARAQAALARVGDVRWVPPENWHFTLKFLGSTPLARVPELAAILEEIAKIRFKFVIELGGMGAFPNARRPQVIWIGARAGSEAMEALAAEVDAGCARLGFPRGQRPFRAHLTIGRVRSERDRDALAARLAAAPQESLASWWATELHLVQSTLLPAGAVYRTLRRFPFGG